MSLTCNCKRCGKLCQTAEKKGTGRPIRKTDVPDGCCAECAITCYMKTSPLMDVLGGWASAQGFEIEAALRLPHVQQQFAAVFRAGGIAELSDEIDWERVIANWEMPLPTQGWDWKGQI